MTVPRTDIVLCILPGFDGTDRLFGSFIDSLPPEQSYRLVTYPLDRQLDLDELTTHAEAQIPTDVPILLIGVSYSGPIAIRLIDRGNRNYVGAVFCVTFALPPRPVLIRLLSLLPIGRFVRYLSWQWALRIVFFDSRAEKRLTSILRSIIEEFPPSVITHRFRQLRNVDERDRLKKILIPSLYLQASNDVLVPSRSVLPFRTHLSQLEVRRIKGPHALLSSRPKECREVIDRFSASLKLTS